MRGCCDSGRRAPWPKTPRPTRNRSSRSERVGVDVQRGGDLGGGTAAVAEGVRDAELRGDPECLRVDDPEAPLEDRDLAAGAVRR